MRLSAATLDALPGDVARPGYRPDSRGIGIVHFGIGAFHRAHQAVYTDDALAAGEGDWRIVGVSLRSAGARDQLVPQNCLYTLAERSEAGVKARIVGSIAGVLHAPTQRAAVVAALAAPATHIASLTITEKGYCRAADGSLDPALADEGSAYAYLAEAFRRRRDAGLPGLTLLSCDNLAGNGAQLRRLMGGYLGRHAPDLAGWLDSECACPATMVDRIVPAATADDLTACETMLGMRDEAAVFTEPFSQWVIEDRFAGPRPRWEDHGAQLVSDLRPYETAKLRMLNGAHSLLAYLGLARGHNFVHQAIADPHIRPLAERLMRQEAAPTIAAAPGQDLDAYADALLERFANPALRHRLIQIAMDGSQKLPQRWFDTLAECQRTGRRCDAILTGLAAWLRHIRGDNAAAWGPVDDPMASELAAAWRSCGSEGIVEALFGPDGLLASPWRPDAAARDMLAGSVRE